MYTVHRQPEEYMVSKLAVGLAWGANQYKHESEVSDPPCIVLRDFSRNNIVYGNIS